MEGAAGPALRERGWRKLLPALAAFLFLPLAPPFCLLFPVEQTLALVVPAIAACALVGWRSGGRLTAALFWVLLALCLLSPGFTHWLLRQPPAVPASAFDVLMRGWALVLAAAFGTVCLLSAHRTFFVRGLSAVALAGGLALVAVVSAPSGIARVAGVLTTEYAQRSQYWADELTRQAQSNDPMATMLRERGLAADAAQVQRFAADSTAVMLAPALLALESLAALALAWGLYHRFTRVRVGLPLAPLREFRFNDQLVWALIAGVAFVLLEALSGLRAPGLNMLVFFGTLYAVRGMGVLAWFLAPDRLVMVPLFIFALLVWPLIGAVALCLGLGDTWVDWRSRAPRPAA